MDCDYIEDSTSSSNSSGSNSNTSSDAAITILPTPTGERPIFQIARASSFFLEDSERHIAGDLTEAGLLVHLDKNVPLLLPPPTKAFAEALLSAAGVKGSEAFWAIHPGGRAILDAIQRVCGLRPDQMEHSRWGWLGLGFMEATRDLSRLETHEA